MQLSTLFYFIHTTKERNCSVNKQAKIGQSKSTLFVNRMSIKKLTQHLEVINIKELLKINSISYRPFILMDHEVKANDTILIT